MEINDILLVKQDLKEMFEITFADEEAGDDCARILLSKTDMWQIAHYCHDELSVKAQRKKKL